MGSQRLEFLEFLAAFWKARPLKGSTDTRLKRNLYCVPAKIKRSVEAPVLQEYLSVSKPGSGYRTQVFR